MLTYTKLYLKCAVANRATLAGFIATGAGAACCALALATTSSELALIGLMVAFVGFCLLLLTTFGLETFVKYLQARRLIEQGKVARVREKAHKGFYCGRTGVRLALAEA